MKMKNNILTTIILSSYLFATFSIVAVDRNTREVGSAGGSCIANSIIISDIHPNVGVIHTQSYWLSSNQTYASNLMNQGYSPLKACEEAICRIIKKHRKKNKFQVAFIALRKDGEFGAAAINDGFSYILYNQTTDNTICDVKGIVR